MKNIFNILTIILGISISCFWSCSESFLDKEPSTQLRPEQIKTLDDVNTLLNGAYDDLSSNSYYNNFYLSKNDVRGDDMLSLKSSRLGRENRYQYEEYSSSSDMWSKPYTVIRQVNRVLEHLEKIEISEEQEALKNHIKGQALTIRALAHFDLCKMFGKPYSFDKGASLGIPICTKVLDWNAKKSRNTVAEVYKQIKTDLEAAIPLLSEEREDGYLNRWGAKALLSRMYLYMEEDGDAFDIAEDIILHSDYDLVSRDKYVNSWAEAFTSESIFSISNSLVDNGGKESIANYADPDGYYILAATKKFVDIIDENDVRKGLLYNDYYTRKYKVQGRVLKFPGLGNTKDKIIAHWNDSKVKINPASTSSIPVIRLSEVYLIAAEAAVKDGDIPNAKKYINAIITRANPAEEITDDSEVTLDRVLLERRKELVSEGHRFFDLIRNKRDIERPRLTKRQSSSVPTHIDYDYYKIVFPIPISEINANPNLEQNEDY